MNTYEQYKKGSFKTWFRIGPFLSPYKGLAATIIITMLFNAAVDIIMPVLAGYAVNTFVEPRQTEGIWSFGALYFVLIAVQGFSVFIFGKLAIKLEVQFGRDMKRSIFSHLQELSFSYFNVTPVGTIMARVMSDTNRISGVVAWSLVDIFWSLIFLIGCITVMLVSNWKLGLLIVIIVPFVAFLTAFFQKKILTTNRKAREINAEITRHYNEGITGAKTSKTLVIEDKNTETFSEVTGRMKRTSIHATFLSAMYVPLIVFFTSLAVAFVLTSGGNMVMLEDITIGELTMFINYALLIADPVQNLAGTLSNAIATQPNVERCCDLLELEPDITDSPEVIEKYGTSLEPKRENWEPLQGHITFDNISFMYSDGTEYVLENFNLDVPEGTTVAIVGETGAGKSTLVNLACRFFEPTKGKILIDGRDYKDRSMLWLHSNIGYVLQTPHLFSGSVKENIRYGKLESTDEQIVAAAKLVGADEFIMSMDKGYDSDVGEGGGQLSTGQKQLLSFARAVLADPKIFVLDEATSSIDTKTEALIQTAISSLLENRTSFLIAHRLSTIRQADIILVVRDGKIIERGTHKDLMSQNGYYADLYNKQFENEATEVGFS